MPFNLGLLSEASLEGLKPEVKDALQQQATKQFFVGSLLGGDPSMAFRSATSVPADYFARQQQILSQQQQAERDRAVASAYQPTVPPFNKGSEQVKMLGDQLEGLSPQDVEYESSRIFNTGMGVVPRKFNPASFMENVLPIIGRTDPTKMAETIKNMRPYSVEGGNVLMDAFTNKPLSYVPSMDKGEEPVFDSRGNIVGVKNLEGKVTAIKERALAEKEAAAAFEFKPVVENGQEVLRSAAELAGVDRKANLDRAQGDVAGLQRQIAEINKLPSTDATKNQRLSILNQELTKAQEQVKTYGGASPAPVSKLSAPEAAYQGGWEKIRDSAYKGYEIANGRSGTLQSLQNIMNRPDFDTNAFTNYKTQLAGVLKASGLANEQQKQFLNSAAGFRQGLNTIAAQSVAELSGSTSNFDLEFSQGRFAKIEDPKQANQYAIDLMAASDARKKEYYNFVNQNRTPDVNQRWQQTEAGKTSIFDSKKMSKYLPVVGTVKEGQHKGLSVYQLPSGEQKIYP